MNEQWPSERHTEKREGSRVSSFKTKQDFLNLLNAYANGLLQNFDDVVIWIVEQSGDLSELEQRLAPVAQEFTSSIPDGDTLLMTLACAAALARAPSLQTWRKINAFKCNSWQLEHWLSEAMTAYSEVNTSACSAYVQLAKDAFAALDNFTLESQFTRTNNERSGAWAYWITRQDKLEEIWWDLRGWHGFMNYEEELPLFRVFYTLNPNEFIHTISSSANPYLVNSLLFVASVGVFSPRFSEWKRVVTAAPIAFDNDGKWNGSILIPLLLVEARNQLLQVRQNLWNPDLTTGELDELKQQIISTAELIANTLATRLDASAIFCRWTPWLIRQTLGQTIKESIDVKSFAFADNALIDAIGRKLENSMLPQTSPDDAPLWEDWCYRCAQASFAYNGHIQSPEWESFGNEWRLSPEDWVGDKGQRLRGHASLINTLNNEIPGVAANLLAYPIAQAISPTEVWIGLWNDTFALREIVEFGDSDATEDEYSSRSEPGRLLFLLFRIGLAIFDQGASLNSDNNSHEARSLARLFKALDSAASEMQEIDSTLNHDEWRSVVQHLAIRRMIWEPSSTSTDIQVFRPDDLPTISDILSKEKGNVIEMVAILRSLLLNVSESRLKAELNSASIDVSNIVQSFKRLNEYHPNKYPIDEAQLQKLGALI